MMHDLINDAIVNIKNHERIGKSQCIVRPTSKLLIDILKIFQKEGYIGEFELMEDKRGGQIKVKLVKKINDCGVIKPRFSVKHNEFPKWEKRYLPARDFGTLVVTTPKGVMSHKEAKKNGIGGRLLAYIY
ncbi:MAG: 30S ribosomal protein S8 [Candidatus Altiarchaeales archaeon]|nr:MAG: 30S ribosomal protein S8 [Candidatus Altiarchaeales archaeon]HDI73185.1 30S ribosomal protein S8 [Candidatus Altiarchaeales archaeon]